MTLILHPVPHAGDAKIHVFVEDTSYADAPAVILLHEVLPAAPGSDGSQTVCLPDPKPPSDPTATLTVRILVDLDNDARISPGDWISTESHAVSGRLAIALRQV